MKLLFVGERRSNTAVRMGVTWRDGRLCAMTLHRALKPLGVDPAACDWTNAYTDAGEICLTSLIHIARRSTEDVIVVALGAKAQRALDNAGIPYVGLVHPAARGAIRKTERYQQHVADILGPVLQAERGV